jgi:lipopolysaccharide export system permease protein
MGKNKARGYIISHFTQSFLTVFLPFFFIIALIYLVKIASLTAQISITFSELLLLFSYSIPDIIFYTLPISFIVALANVLIRLSSENELIAMYALGFGAHRIIRSLFRISLLFSLFLLVIAFLAMPTSKQLYKSFKENKKRDAQLNIVPGKLGQKFGDFYVYVRKKDNRIYKDLVIYSRSDLKHERFFAAKYGKIRKNDTQGSLLLIDGFGYTYGENTLQQAKYNTFEIFDKPRLKPFHFQDILTYWSLAEHDRKIRHRIFFFLFIGLIPLLSVYIIAAFTMINPRYQSGHTFSVIFFTALTLYLTASSLEKWGNVYTLVLSVLSIIGIGIILFKYRVARYF